MVTRSPESEADIQSRPLLASASSGRVPPGTATAGAGLPLARLPNDLEVAFQSRGELEHFYQDIFEKEIYVRHGIELPDDACVFDVGANIGLFTLYVQTRWPGSRVYAFEPAPPLFELLSRNAERYAPGTHLFQCGVSDVSGRADLTFYPESSGMSSFHADAGEEREALRAVLLNEARAGVAAAEALQAHAEDYLDERLKSQDFSCRLATLGEVLREHRVERVDLVKIDVQKSELQVLLGLEDDQWPRIRQLAIEVHDVDGRVAEVRRRLDGHGFEVVVEQDELYRGSNLYNLFARRSARRRSARRRSARRRAVTPSAADAPSRPESTLPAPAASRGWHLLPVAAGSGPELEAVTDNLVDHLGSSARVAEVAHALQLACLPREHRRVVVCRDGRDAAAALAARDPKRVWSTVRGIRRRPVVFLFPGLGDHYPGMARDLYDAEPLFRATVDECCDKLEPELGQDLRRVLYPEDGAGGQRPVAGIDLKAMLGRGGDGGRSGGLKHTFLAQPAVFVVEYALGRLWRSWGVEPQAMVGYSLGEYVAACHAGVLSLDEALELVAWRARRIEALPEGAMLAVSLSAEALMPWLGDGVSLSSVGGPENCVAAGQPEEIAALETRLAGRGVVCRRLETTHAFHSAMMRPLVEPLAERMAGLLLEPPRIPYLSNVTGSWIAPSQATDPRYWARHLVDPVRFDDNLWELWSQPQRVLLEVGPGQALGSWALQHPAGASAADPLVLASLRHLYEPHSDVAFLLRAVGRLWLAGIEPDWHAFHGSETPPRALPSELLTPRIDAVESALSSAGSGAAPDEGPPRDDLEAGLCEIWRELLGLRTVSRHAGFFELGGNSLLATRLLDRLAETWAVAVSLRELFESPTVAELAAAIRARQAAAKASPPATEERSAASASPGEAAWEEGEL